MKTGIELITEERSRQISEEGYTPEHDDDHVNGELVMAAACYAAPSLIYGMRRFAKGVTYIDPFPFEDPGYDKRFYVASASGNVLPDPRTYTVAEQLDLVVKAGALMAAEADRLQRIVGGHGVSDLRFDEVKGQ